MAAELKAIASLDGKNFEAGIKRVKGQTDSFANKLSGMKGMIAGAFSIGAITMFGRKMLTMADDLNTAANSVGITMESMLGLKSAMAESGIGAERMLKLLSRLPIAQGDVMNGLKTMTDALDGLKISQEEFVSLAPDELMERLAQAYADSGGSAEAFNGIAKIFGGRIGPEMIEVLQRLNKDGLKKFTDGSKEASEGMTALAEASDKIEKFINRLTIVFGKLVGWLMKAYDYAVAFSSAMFEGAMDGSDFEGRMEKFRRNLAEDAAKADAEIAAKRKKYDDEVKARAEANIEALAKSREDQESKLTDQRIKNEQRIAKAWLDYYDKLDDMEAKDQDRQDRYLKLTQDRQDILADSAEKRSGLMSGQGVPVGDQARVNNLQRMGGIVGGVAGVGDQEARIAERQAKAAEMVEKLTAESLRKLEEIEKRIRELGEG